MPRSPLQKYGLILLACFAPIVLLLIASSNLNFKESITVRSYFNNLQFGSQNGSSNSNYDVFITGDNSTRPNPNNITQHKSFAVTFQDFPWTEFESAANKNVSSTESFGFSKLFIEELTYFLEQEPLIRINETCQAPEPELPTEINCSKYPAALSGVKRAKPIKIGTLVQFGFDVDVLEIHLNELYGIVDQFFIIESTHALAHNGNIKKPLMWEHVQRQERFQKFPVIHFIIDDAEGSKASDKLWAMESLQERLRWLKFLEWNDASKYFDDEDILGFGDTDEIPSRARLHLLKYCELKGKTVDFEMWFPFGHINQAFPTDHPVRGHPLTLGDPTYYKLRSAKAFGKLPNKFPSRQRGHSANYLLGGIHMTHYGYLPSQLVKLTTATEGGFRSVKQVQELSKYFRTGDIRNMEIDMGATPKVHLTRIKKVNLAIPEMQEICVLPWFYDCNRQRYPVWEGGHDTRLD